MSVLRSIRWVLVLLSISLVAAAQDSSQYQTAPAPAFGQTAPILNPDNPPLSGLDEPSLEMKTASRSFISPAVQVGESYDSNAANALSGSKGERVSNVLGALDLQIFWPKTDLFLEYLGGGVFGDNPYFVRELQAVGFEGVTRWRTGQVTARDGFSYLPDGSFFAASAGGLPGFGIATGGGIGTGSALPGLLHFGTGIGTIPRLSNTGSLDVVQAITPRSAFTLIGAFANAHYFDNTDNLSNSDQTTVEGGYSHLINRHDQLAAVEAFQLFQFPTTSGGEIYNDVFNIRWSHTISGKMSFVGGVGPQWTEVRYVVISPNWSVAGRAALRYRFRHTSMLASYEKFTTAGGGIFTGAQTQIAQLTARRPIGRTFDLTAEGGYSHNKRLQAAGSVNANIYDEGFAGATLRKHLNRTWDIIGAYRFSEAWFDVPVTIGGSTGKTNRRQIGTIALEWHPKAIRIE